MRHPTCSSWEINVSSALMSICFQFLRTYITMGDPKSFREFFPQMFFLIKKCYLIKMTTILNHFYVVWKERLQFHTNYLKPNYK